MPFSFHFSLLSVLLGLLMGLGASQAALADGGHEGGSRRPVPLLPKYPQECAACHTQADQGNFNEHDVRIPR